MSNKVFGLILLILVGVVAFGVYHDTIAPQATGWREYANIQRVFMHEPGKYSFAVLNEDGALDTVDLRSSLRTRVFTDVVRGEPMYARIMYPKKDTTRVWYAEIHVHDAQSINPAGWDHGKLGRGQTVAIE
ncbi:MAG: hypothetical protein AAB417_03980 [Patescibacteria group bacterium]